MDAPNAPSGNSNEAAWLRRLRAFCVSLRILPGNGYKVRRTTLGTILEILPGAGGKKGGGLVYRGDFDDTVSYYVGDIVRNRNGAYVLGVFICVKDNPIGGPATRSAGPVYPEPASPFWHLLVPGPIMFVTCKAGTPETRVVSMIDI